MVFSSANQHGRKKAAFCAILTQNETTLPFRRNGVKALNSLAIATLHPAEP
jgi:hypothetical protein